MNTKRLLLVCLVFLVLLPSGAFGQDPAVEPETGAMETSDESPAAEAVVPEDIEAVYDMGEAVSRALEANPQIKAIRRAYIGAKYGVKSARGNFGPTAGTTYGYQNINRGAAFPGAPVPDDRWDWSVTVSQPLFTGWRNLSTYEKSILQKEQTKAQIYQTELSLTLSVQESFLALLKAREDVRSAQDQVKRLDEQLDVTDAFYEVGLKPRLDVLQAEARLSQAENELVVARNQVRTQTARLNTLLNIPLEAEVQYVGELEYMPFSMSLEHSLDQAYEKRPDLVIAKKSVAIATKDKKITESEFYPQVDANMRWQTWGDDPTAAGAFEQRNNFSEWSAGVTATWTFFQSGKVYYASKQAEERIRQLMFEADNTWQEATFEVKSNLLDIGEAAERIQVARTALAASRESYRMALARYQAQVGTNIDVLDAQAQVTQSEADLTQALADYRLAIARIFVSMGVQNPGLQSY